MKLTTILRLVSQNEFDVHSNLNGIEKKIFFFGPERKIINYMETVGEWTVTFVGMSFSVIYERFLIYFNVMYADFVKPFYIN